MSVINIFESWMSAVKRSTQKRTFVFHISKLFYEYLGLYHPTNFKSDIHSIAMEGEGDMLSVLRSSILGNLVRRNLMQVLKILLLLDRFDGTYVCRNKFCCKD
jgi:hypothetical protein